MTRKLLLFACVLAIAFATAACTSNNQEKTMKISGSIAMRDDVPFDRLLNMQDLERLIAKDSYDVVGGWFGTDDGPLLDARSNGWVELRPTDQEEFSFQVWLAAAGSGEYQEWKAKATDPASGFKDLGDGLWIYREEKGLLQAIHISEQRAVRVSIPKPIHGADKAIATVMPRLLDNITSLSKAS